MLKITFVINVEFLYSISFVIIWIEHSERLTSLDRFVIRSIKEIQGLPKLVYFVCLWLSGP